MEYLRQILSIHGASLFALMILSTVSMGRIFTILGDLRMQVTAIQELVPHLRASLSSRNFTKAAVTAAGNEGSIARLMVAVLQEPTRDPHRMRLIYKVNIDTELRRQLAILGPLRTFAMLALFIGVAGGLASWGVGSTGMGDGLIRAFVVGGAGFVVFAYSLVSYFTLKRKEIELNDAVAGETLKLIDTVARAEEIPV
jgi:hypothetical protein